MSGLDLTSSFWQIPLEKESKKYTVFSCDNKIYEYNVVPFGIKSSSTTLIRDLDLAIRDLREFVIAFVDDLLIKSKTCWTSG